MGLAQALSRVLGRRPRPGPAPLCDDGTLHRVGGCDDPARADSAVLDDIRQAGVDTDTGPFVVRYRLVLPDHDAVDQARVLLSVDGWTLDADPPGAQPEEHQREPRGESREETVPAPGLPVRAWRQQRLSGLELARERTRMAGLAQRLGGRDLGWDVLARPSQDEPGTAAGG